MLAGHTHEEGLAICHCANLTDWCSRTFLSALHAPLSAATTQLQLELMEVRTDLVGLQNITRIWSSFHFLPYDLAADPGRGGRSYRERYRLICRPNGDLVRETVELARDKGPQAVGLAMHVLADTWAHQNFAGTPSLVINNASDFVERVPGENGVIEREIRFRHSATAPDDIEAGIYTCSPYQPREASVMNLGHGRAGHLPDYSFARYRYVPAWGDYEEVERDNPHDYWLAFCQMVHAMRCLREGVSFAVGVYDEDAVRPWEGSIRAILERRQLDARDDWRALCERMGEHRMEPFDLDRYQQEYSEVPQAERDDTFLGHYFMAALAQKSMVTNRIHRSGSLLAGISVDYDGHGLSGVRDYFRLVRDLTREGAR